MEPAGHMAPHPAAPAHVPSGGGQPHQMVHGGGPAAEQIAQAMAAAAPEAAAVHMHRADDPSEEPEAVRRRLETSVQMMEGTGLAFSPSRNPAAAAAAVANPFAPQEQALHQKMLDWRAWANGPFFTIFENVDDKNRAQINEGTIAFHELITKHGMGQDTLTEFARTAGVELSGMDLLRCLATYRMRQSLVPIFAEKRFQQETPPPPAQPQHLGSHPDPSTAQTPLTYPAIWPQELPQAVQQRHIDDLARQLQAVRFENERMRQTMIPPLNVQEVTVLLQESLPYVWQQTIMSALKVKMDASPQTDFGTNRFYATIWRLVHEELRNRRQGRHSAAVSAPAYQPQFHGGGGYHKPGVCHRCGQPGHWARDCPHMHMGMPQMSPAPYMPYPPHQYHPPAPLMPPPMNHGTPPTHMQPPPPQHAQPTHPPAPVPQAQQYYPQHRAPQ